MTAIAIGKTINGTFGVIDSMVQMDANVNNYKDCRLQEKISEIETSNQFLLLCGEEIIASGASFIESWCKMKKLKLDLFDVRNFQELLISSDRYRQYVIDFQKQSLIPQNSTTVYIIDKRNIREYIVKHNGTAYYIVSSSDFKDNEQKLNYKGNIKTIQVDQRNVIKSAISELLKEHEWRKNTGYTLGKYPLEYDFVDRYSAILFNNDTLTERLYPFNELTDQYLSWGNDWNYVENPIFKYSPVIQ